MLKKNRDRCDNLVHSPPPAAASAGVDVREPRMSRVGILRPLRIKDFAILWSGMTISLLGDGIYLVAIAFQVYELSNSPTALSVVFFAWTAPMVLFFLLAGVLTDRFDRRWLMLTADVIRGVSLGVMGVLSITGNLTLTHIYILVALYGIGDAFFMPAFTAIVPDIVPKALLLEANSLDQFVRPLTMRMLGPAAGGVLVATAGAGWALTIDALTFVASGIAVTILCTRPIVQRQVEGAGERSALREIAEGFRFVRAHTWLWGTLLSAAVGLLAFIGPLEVLIPYVVKNELGGGAGAYGVILALGGVGALIASFLMGQRGLPKRHITFMYSAWGIGVLMIAVFAFVGSVAQGMAVSLVMSGMFAAGMIVWGTLMHRLVPAELMGRVSSLDWLISTALVPVSFILTGPISNAIGVEETLIGAGLIGSALTFVFLLIPGIRDTEKDGSLAEEPVEERQPALL
jgi:DHA3 family tetracycline resistance protein-like MFS transporter